MFIYNVKLSGTMIFKFVFVIIILIVLIVFGITTYKIYNACNNSYDYTNSKDFIELNSHNYANVLKMVHEDIDTYVGQKIKFSGFIYRVYDLNQQQFVLGRNMIISSDLQTVVIGFLCEYKDAITLKDLREKSINYFRIQPFYKNLVNFIVKYNDNDNDDKINILSEDDIIKDIIEKSPKNSIIKLLLTLDKNKGIKLMEKD